MNDYSLLQRAANFLAGGHLDRAPELRRDADWCATHVDHDDCLLVLIWRSANLIAVGPTPRAVFVGGPEVRSWRNSLEHLVFLGREREGAQRIYFSASLQDSFPRSELETRFGAEFRDLKRSGALMPVHESALLAYARAMIHWHRHHGYCGKCGSVTESFDGGHARRCRGVGCGLTQFPRTDSAIIVLITQGERCLLARERTWTAGVYATIAGFLEPGESLEEAVRRETMEEVGLVLDQVCYHSSQPWPFPASIMVGFTAVARDTRFVLDAHEIEDARWFSRETMRAGILDGSLKLPSRVSISFRLIQDWFDEGQPGALAVLLASSQG